MNSKDVELLMAGFAQVREQAAIDMAQVASAIVAVANAQMIETIRSAMPTTVPRFPGLDVKELGKLFFKQVIEQRRIIEDESRCS